LGHELVEPRVVHVAGMCDAQLRDDVTGMPFPVDQHAAHARIREQPVDAVPLETVRGVEVIVYDRSRTIPCEEVPSLAMHPRGAMSELLEQTAHARSHAARMGVAVAARLAVMPREREEVLRLAGLEPQCRGDPLQCLRGRLNVPRLLEPRIPLGADAGERGYLFTPQSRRAAALAARQ